MTRVGQRGLYLGGWDPEAVVARNEAMTLDLEDELERQRRLDDEFSARLKREKFVLYIDRILSFTKNVIDSLTIIYKT